MYGGWVRSWWEPLIQLVKRKKQRNSIRFWGFPPFEKVDTSHNQRKEIHPGKPWTTYYSAGYMHKQFTYSNGWCSWGWGRKWTKRQSLHWLDACMLRSFQNKYTLQGINISHLGERKIIFKSALVGDMLVPWRVYIYTYVHTYLKINTRFLLS